MDEGIIGSAHFRTSFIERVQTGTSLPGQHSFQRLKVLTDVVSVLPQQTLTTGLLLFQLFPELTHLNTAREGFIFQGRRSATVAALTRLTNLRPSAVGEFGQQLRRGLFLPGERRLQVVYGVSLVLPNSQTQATDELSILDTVHVQGLPVVLLATRRSRLLVTLVLRQKVNE